MPKHVRSIDCCYCGASTLLNLRDANENSLKCGECGARMAVTKMAPVAVTPQRKREPYVAPVQERSLAKQWQDGTNRHKKDDNKNPKHKKKKGFFDRLEDIWDDVTDIFD